MVKKSFVVFMFFLLCPVPYWLQAAQELASDF